MLSGSGMADDETGTVIAMRGWARASGVTGLPLVKTVRRNPCRVRAKMPISRATVIAVSTGLVLVLLRAAQADASSRARSGCRSRSDVVFKVPGGNASASGGMSGEEHTYICAYAGGRSVEIGKAGNPIASSEGGEGPSVQSLAFAGEIAGVAYTDEEGARELQVIDLTSGRTQFSFSLGGGSESGVPGEVSEAGQEKVGAVVVKSDGSVAWTEKGPEPGGYEVLEHDRVGTVVLDDEMSTAARSLTLTGSTLRWRWYDGKSHSARLD